MLTLKFLVIVLICFDLVLFLFIAFFLIKIRKISPKGLEELITRLKESQELVDRLQKLVDEKTKLAAALEAQLVRKTNNKVEQTKVVQLYHTGLDLGQIAEITGLTTGEVELILSIKNVSDS